jgi:sporulenol synthase
MIQRLITKQSQDGAWRFCYESGVMTDAYMIIVLRTLQTGDEEWIRALHHRILSREANGAWKVYPDEDGGNLSATVEAFSALLYSGYSMPTDANMLQAKRFIHSRGGLRNLDSLLTKVMLACLGQYPWPSFFLLPLELLLIPSSAPIDFFDFYTYARIHLVPTMVLSDKKPVIRNEKTPDLSYLVIPGAVSKESQTRPERSNPIWDDLNQFVQEMGSIPEHIHQQAAKKAEQYMLESPLN